MIFCLTCQTKLNFKSFTKKSNPPLHGLFSSSIPLPPIKHILQNTQLGRESINNINIQPATNPIDLINPNWFMAHCLSFRHISRSLTFEIHEKSPYRFVYYSNCMHQRERLQQQVRFRGIFLLLGSSQHCSQDHRQARRTRRRRLWRKKRGRPAKESPFPPYSPPRTNIMLSTIMFDFTARAITFPFLLDFPVSFCLLLFFEDLEVQIEVKKGRGDSSIPRSSRLRGRWSKLDHVQRSSSSNNINLLLIQWGKTKLR